MRDEYEGKKLFKNNKRRLQNICNIDMICILIFIITIKNKNFQKFLSREFQFKKICEWIIQKIPMSVATMSQLMERAILGKLCPEKRRNKEIRH